MYFNFRLEGGRQCILVLMGATADGKKELIAIQDGQRESEQSWQELLLDVQARGLTIEPKLAIPRPAGRFFVAMEIAGLILEESSLHYFPRGSDARLAEPVHHGGYCLMGNFAPEY